MKRGRKLTIGNREGTLLITILVIFVLMCLIKGRLFYARSNIEAIFSNLAYDLLLACGMTFVIILGGVDLSVGAVLALTGIICTLLIQQGVATIVAVLAGVLFGAGLSEEYTAIGRGTFLGIPNRIFISILIMLILAVLSRSFRPLKNMFYVGGNTKAAFISGIPSGLTTVLGYGISGLMAGIAAVLMTSSLGMGHASYGISFEMKAISAAVIGGANMHGGSGSFLGTALGVILVALVNNVFIMFNGSPNWSSAISGVMLLLAVGFDVVRNRVKSDRGHR